MVRPDVTRLGSRVPVSHRHDDADWRWVTPQAQLILRTGQLGSVLRFYRAINGLSQSQLGCILGYDKTYISALELGKRTLDDVSSLRRLCQVLRLPPHVLGITDAADSDHRALVQFGESTVRLAEIARQAGHAMEAVTELWPLAARLETRLAEGRTERDMLRLLARARTGLGVALGNVLPEEQLSTAAHWTAGSITVARHLDDPALMSYVLRMHGNELRKVRLHGAAVSRLRQAVAAASDGAARAAALLPLARAAGALGDGGLFDQTLGECADLLETVDHTSVFNPFAVHEVQLRGLVATGRAAAAIRLAGNTPVSATMVAPQWHVIEQVTVAHVQMLAGDHHAATHSLSTAADGAVSQRLPHQLQRIIRIAGSDLPEIRGAASCALERLREQLAA